MNKQNTSQPPRHPEADPRCPFYYNPHKEDIAICPYDKAHVMLAHRLQQHIFRCHNDVYWIQQLQQQQQQSKELGKEEEEEENWDHFNWPSYLTTLREKRQQHEIEKNWDHIIFNSVEKK